MQVIGTENAHLSTCVQHQPRMHVDKYAIEICAVERLRRMWFAMVKHVQCLGSTTIAFHSKSCDVYGWFSGSPSTVNNAEPRQTRQSSHGTARVACLACLLVFCKRILIRDTYARDRRFHVFSKHRLTYRSQNGVDLMSYSSNKRRRCCAAMCSGAFCLRYH